MLPAPSRPGQQGRLNRAALFVPSALPLTPAFPARVVTTQFVPTGVISRMVSLSPSATYTLPLVSTATPLGSLNRAALFVPSALPGLPAFPASVVTTQVVPTGVTFRIAWLLASAT